MDETTASVITMSVFFVCAAAVVIAWIIWGRD